MTIGNNSSAHFYDTSFTTFGTMYSEAAGVFTSSATGSAGEVWTSNGVGSAPTFQAASFGSLTVDADTGTASPIANVLKILGTSIVAGSVPVQTTGATNTITVEVQTCQAIAATDATKIGLAAFDSARFSVDANGFVSTSGTGLGETITGQSGGALSPTGGNWNIFGASTAAGTSPVVTSGSVSTLTVNVQKSQAIASTDATKIGLAAFDSADFTVDANGFVSGSTTGFIKTLTGNSGGAISPTANNINTLGTGSITIAGSGSTLTTQLTGLTNHNVLVGAGTATITNVAPSATSGIPLVSNGSSADPSFTTAVVAGGGTGVTSATAYALLAGGTTSTGAFQSLTSGSSGQILQSNGSSSLPTWIDNSSAGNLVLIQSQVANNSASITFTTGITSTYSNYLLLMSNFKPATNNTIVQLTISTNGGSTYIATGYLSGIIGWAYNSSTIGNANTTT